METLIHKSDGRLISDLPWWLREGKIRAINNSTGALSFGIRLGSIVTIDNGCIARTKNIVIGERRKGPSVIYVRLPNGNLVSVIRDAFEPVE